MTDFVLVVATIATISPAPALPGSPASSAEPQPTALLRLYPNLESCQQEATSRAAAPGYRLLCVPVERLTDELPNAY